MARMFKFTGIAEEIEWQPTDIGGCKLWVRSDLAWQDAAKIVPCVNESLIWTGEDKSGNGKDFIQATEAKRPVYLINQINGHPAWRFDGIDDFLRNAAITLNQPIDMYLVVKQITYSYTDRILGDGAPTWPLQIGQLTLTPNLKIYSGIDWVCENGDLAIGSFGLLQARFDGASSLIRINGGTPTTGNPGAGNASALSFGVEGEGASFCNMDLVEVVFYNPILSDTNRHRLELYFNTEAQGNGYALY